MKKFFISIFAIASSLPSLCQSATIELDWGISIIASYPNMEISVGDTVKWTWIDPFSVSHNVVIQDGIGDAIFQTPLTSGAGHIETYTFDTEGEYTFFCDPHAGSMNGSLTVSAVPVPGAIWLFTSGLMGIIGYARRSS